MANASEHALHCGETHLWLLLYHGNRRLVEQVVKSLVRSIRGKLTVSCLAMVTVVLWNSMVGHTILPDLQHYRLRGTYCRLPVRTLNPLLIHGWRKTMPSCDQGDYLE